MKTDADRLKAERSLVGCLLIDAARLVPLAVNEGVETDWFTSRPLALCWAAMQTLWAEKVGVDAVTVLDRARRLAAAPKSPFAGEDATLVNDVQAAIDETPTASHFEHYLALVRNEVMFRRIEKAHYDFAKAIHEGGDVSIETEAFSRRVVAVLSGSMSAKAVSLPAALAQIEADYLAAHRKRVIEKDLEYTPGIPLPWRAVNLASQGVQEGLYYLGARPSVGKTAFVLNLIRAWCEAGVKVGFNSLDMAVKPMLKRPVGELSRVSFAKASFGTTSGADLEAIHAAIYGERDAAGQTVRRGVADWPLTLVQERDVDSFRAWCVAMRQTGSLDVAVVDFVQLLGTRARYANDNEKLEHVSGVLKSIAIDLDIPVIALSQLNRACEDDGGRVPTASDLRGSGALEQDATAVWILHADREVSAAWFARDERGDCPRMPVGLTVNATAAEFKGIAPVRLIIAKNQNGQAGADVWFPFVFFKKYCLFMLGDPDAACPVQSVGYGVSAKKVTDFSPRYARVTHDWRADPFERALRLHGCLIGGETVQEDMGV